MQSCVCVSFTSCWGSAAPAAAGAPAVGAGDFSVFFCTFLHFPLMCPATTLIFFHDFLPFLTPHHSAARELEGKRKKIFFAKNAHHPMVASFSLSSVSPRQIRPARAPDSKIAHFHVFSWFSSVFPGKSSIREGSGICGHVALAKPTKTQPGFRAAAASSRAWGAQWCSGA